MTQILELCEQLLRENRFATSKVATPRSVLLFEDATVLGFIIDYSSASELVAQCKSDAESVVGHFQMALRRSALKAWNTNIFFLAADAADATERAALTSIEEDLVGTRKIARAGVQSRNDVREALLSLLPIQNAPSIEAVDMQSEIRLRTSELPSVAVDAFVQLADTSTVLQLLGSLE